MSRPHPSPFAYRKRPVLVEPGVVGWFLVSFKPDPDHEYTFNAYEDGSILPDIDRTDREERCRTLFAEYLADPDFHAVRFVRQTPSSPEETDIAMYGRSPC